MILLIVVLEWVSSQGYERLKVGMYVLVYGLGLGLYVNLFTVGMPIWWRDGRGICDLCDFIWCYYYEIFVCLIIIKKYIIIFLFEPYTNMVVLLPLFLTIYFLSLDLQYFSDFSIFLYIFLLFFMDFTYFIPFPYHHYHYHYYFIFIFNITFLKILVFLIISFTYQYILIEFIILIVQFLFYLKRSYYFIIILINWLKS